jgi:hypothetical protein
MIFLIAFGAMAVGGLLIAAIGAWSPNANLNHPNRPRLVPEGVQMPFEQFQALVIDLLDALKLDVVHMVATATEIDIIVRSSEPLTGGRYLVHAIYDVPGDIVDQPIILRLQDTVKADSAAKGILITPYTISPDGLGNLEVPIELVDGKKLRGLIEKYLPDRMMQVAKYRGFGF